MSGTESSPHGTSGSPEPPGLRASEDTPPASSPDPDGSSEAAVQPVLELIRQLQAGRTSGTTLLLQDRRRVVEQLWLEGYSLVETEAILKVSNRTIYRDRKAIREANGVSASPAFTKEMVGNLVREAETAAGHIRRSLRGADTPVAVRIDGERACWTIARELVQSLQKLGYLPNATQEFRADLTHRLAELPSPEQLDSELRRLEQIEIEHGNHDGVTSQVTKLRQQLTLCVVGEQVQTLASQVVAQQEARSTESES